MELCVTHFDRLNVTRSCVVFFLWSFLLNLIWENAQAPLFQGYESFSQHFPICLKATATGDMIFMLVIYLTLVLVHRDWWWLSSPRTYQQPATWLLPMIIGLLLATSFELWAVHIDHRWQYTAAMPIIPFLQIGLLPLLQMVILPPLTILLIQNFSHRQSHEQKRRGLNGPLVDS